MTTRTANECFTHGNVANSESHFPAEGHHYLQADCPESIGLRFTAGAGESNE